MRCVSRPGRAAVTMGDDAMTNADVLLLRYQAAKRKQDEVEQALRVARSRTSDAFDAWQSELWKERERANRVSPVDQTNGL